MQSTHEKSLLCRYEIWETVQFYHEQAIDEVAKTLEGGQAQDVTILQRGYSYMCRVLILLEMLRCYRSSSKSNALLTT